MKTKLYSISDRSVQISLENTLARLPFPRRANAVVCGLLAAGLLASDVQAALPETVLTDPDGISGFELYKGGLYYWGGRGECTGEFSENGFIRVRETISSPTKRVALNCRINRGLDGNIVRDDNYVYYIDGYDGNIYRKAVIAGETVAASFIANGGGSNPGSVYLELAEGYLYWSHYNVATGVSDFSRVKTDGSEGGHYAQAIDANAAVKKLKFIRYDDDGTDLGALIVLFKNGQLWRYKLNLARTRTLLETGVADFAVHNVKLNIIRPYSDTTYIYAAKGQIYAGESAPPGSLVRINVETLGKATLYTAPNHNQVVAVTTDSDLVIGQGATENRNVYIAEGSPGCQSGCYVSNLSIHRHTTANTTSPWDLNFVVQGSYNLRSDDQWLYFGGISRILIGLPKLHIFHLSATTTKVSWPSSSAGFLLQMTTSVNNPSGWANLPVGTVITDDGTTRSVTVSSVNGPRFYRLRKN